MPRGSFSKDVESAIALAAQRYNLDPEELRAIAQVESSGNPKATTGSYSGLFQLSPEEFKRVGGKGDILDPKSNAMAAASLLSSHKDTFQKHFGRAPDLAELYMIHQQGWGGFQRHVENPDRPAWENMASTREGQARGEEWAKKAISGNLTPEDKKQFGEDLTSGQFIDRWKERIGKMMGQLPRPLEPLQEGEPQQRGYQGELGVSWPSAGQRIGSITSDLLRKGGIEPEPAETLGSVVGTAGEFAGGGLGQGLGRSGALLAIQPSREAAKSFAWEAGGAAPWGRALKPLKTIGGLGIVSGKPKLPLSEGFAKGATKLGDIIEQSATRELPKKSPELPEGWRFDVKKSPYGGGLDFSVIDEKGTEVGSVSMSKYKGKPYVDMVDVSRKHQGKGIANKLYDYIEHKTGYRMTPSNVLLNPGYRLWQSRDPASLAGFTPNVRHGYDIHENRHRDIITGWGPGAEVGDPKPGELITKWWGHPSTQGKRVKYPEYPGLDPYERARGEKSIRAYHAGPEFAEERYGQEAYPLGHFRWSHIRKPGERGLVGHHLYDVEEVANNYRKAEDELIKAKSSFDFDDPAQVAAMEMRLRKGDASSALSKLEQATKETSNRWEKEVYSQAAEQIRSGKKLPELGGSKMYELAIHAKPSMFVDLDKPLSQQSEFVKAVFDDLGIDPKSPDLGAAKLPKSKGGSELPGEDLSHLLRRRGIAGFRYSMPGTEGKEGKPARTYVILNDKSIEILRKYGILPPLAVGTAAAALSQPGKEEAATPQEF